MRTQNRPFKLLGILADKLLSLVLIPTHSEHVSVESPYISHLSSAPDEAEYHDLDIKARTLETQIVQLEKQLLPRSERTPQMGSPHHRVQGSGDHSRDRLRSWASPVRHP